MTLKVSPRLSAFLDQGLFAEGFLEPDPQLVQTGTAPLKSLGRCQFTPANDLAQLYSKHSAIDFSVFRLLFTKGLYNLKLCYKINIILRYLPFIPGVLLRTTFGVTHSQIYLMGDFTAFPFNTWTCLL